MDTSALYALLDEDDDAHDAAVACLGRLEKDAASLMTHDYVVVETTALVQARLGMRHVRRLHEQLLPAVTVVPVAEEIRQRATSALLAADRREVSLVDWVSFEVMRLAELDTAFAFDDDFPDQGFALLSEDV